MALLLKQLNPAISQYKDRRFHGTQQQFDEALHTGTTVYVGNLSFFTTEDQIYEVRRKARRGRGRSGSAAGGGRRRRCLLPLLPPLLQCLALNNPPLLSASSLTNLQVFSKVGDVKRIVMGLDKHRHTPCGFCFVVYYTREDTEDCVKYVNGTMLDDRPIRVDFDWGFMEGRQFGRGRSGGQVREGGPGGQGRACVARQ